MYKEKALTIAKKFHRGQKDKQGRDFILHPIRVAERVEGDYAKAAAILHDTIEDTELSTIGLIEYGFAIEIVDAVAAVTRRRDETYMEFIERIKQSGDLAIQVKIADIQDHLADIDDLGEAGASLKKRYIKALDYLTK